MPREEITFADRQLKEQKDWKNGKKYKIVLTVEQIGRDIKGFEDFTGGTTGPMNRYEIDKVEGFDADDGTRGVKAKVKGM